MVGLNLNDRTIEYGPGITHPGAENRPVRGRLVMGMVSGMFNGLGLCQPADGQDAEHEEDREKSWHGVLHRHRIIHR